MPSQAELLESLIQERQAREQEAYYRERPWERPSIMVAGADPARIVAEAQARADARLNDPRFFFDTPERVNADYRGELGLPPMAAPPIKEVAPRVMNVAGTAIRVNPDGTVTELFSPPPKPQYDTVTEIIPAKEGIEEVPAVPARKGFFGLGARPGTPAIPAIPGTPEKRITRKVPVGSPIQAAGQSESGQFAPIIGDLRVAEDAITVANGALRKFGSEAAAREAGAKNGDTVYLIGIGKVRLK